MTSRDRYQPLINEFSHWIADKSPSSTYWCSFLMSNGLYRSEGLAQELIEAYTPVSHTTSMAVALGTQKIPLSEKEATMKFFYDVREEDADRCLSLMKNVYSDFSDGETDFERYPALKKIEDGDITNADFSIENIEFGTKTEEPFPKGSEFEVYRKVRAEMDSIENEVLILDAYINRELLELYLSDLPEDIDMKIVTKNMKGNFDAVARKFLKKNERELEIREHEDCHDRVLFVDNQCYVLGSSMKDAGLKPTYFIEVNNSERFREVFGELWTEGTPVPIPDE